MKRKKISGIVVCIFLLVFLVSGCNGNDKEATNDITNMSNEWSKDIPGQFIKFGYGKILTTVKDDSTWGIQYSDVSDKDIEKYEKKLKKNGWKKDPDFTEMEPRNYTKGNSETMMVIGVAEKDGTHWVTLYLDYDANPDDY